jgi:hypothetical protein
MAPEHPPSLIIFDGLMKDGELAGSCEYVEPRVPGTRLRVRWGVAESHPEGFTAVGGGVAYVYANETEFERLSTYAAPRHLGGHSYGWSEGLNIGVPWMMFILILPRGYTLSEMKPAPAGANLFQDRLALYWVLPGNELGRTEMFWTLGQLRTDHKTELVRLNRLLSSAAPTQTAGLAIEDVGKMRPNPWVSGSFYLIAAVVIIVVLAVLGRSVDPWVLPLVLIAGPLLVLIVGALQLKSDGTLPNETFLKLMLETLKRLPLLRSAHQPKARR